MARCVALLALLLAGCGQPSQHAAGQDNGQDARWLSTWCNVPPRSTPTVVHGLMGPPTLVTVNGNRREDTWQSQNVTLGAVYMNGRAVGFTVIIGNVPCKDYRYFPERP